MSTGTYARRTETKQDSLCRWCERRLRPCNCGAAGGQQHWADQEWNSRWCPGAARTHEPGYVMPALLPGPNRGEDR